LVPVSGFPNGSRIGSNPAISLKPEHAPWPLYPLPFSSIPISPSPIPVFLLFFLLIAAALDRVDLLVQSGSRHSQTPVPLAFQESPLLLEALKLKRWILKHANRILHVLTRPWASVISVQGLL